MKTIKVKILQSAAGPDGVFGKGAELELPETVAQPLMDCGVAELLTSKPVERAEKAVDLKAEKREKR